MLSVAETQIPILSGHIIPRKHLAVKENLGFILGDTGYAYLTG